MTVAYHHWVRTLAFAAGTLLVAGAASAQEVRSGRNGGWEVHYPGPCTVYYSRNGARTYGTAACSRSQYRMADDAVRARLAGGYGNRPWGDSRYGAEYPMVSMNPGGWGIVRFPNGCSITFNRDGRRIHDSGRCTMRMQSLAQRAFNDQSYGRGQRDYGYDRRGYGGRGGWGYPNITMWNGRIRVQMGGTDCIYIYNTDGNHIQSLGRQCDSRLRDIANGAVRDYRRQRGW